MTPRTGIVGKRNLTSGRPVETRFVNTLDTIHLELNSSVNSFTVTTAQSKTYE